MKLLSLKKLLTATLIVSAFSALTALQAEASEIAIAGVLNYQQQGQDYYLEANSRHSEVISNGELSQLTLTETFTNTSSQAILAHYQIALPNPAALINYSVTIDSDIGCEESSSDQVLVDAGQSVTVTVTYNLVENQLVSFHSTAPQLNASQLSVAQLATTP